MLIKKPKFILIILLIIGALTSFLKSGEVPPGVSHDELEYINNGYSIFATGKDLYGDFLPLTIGGVGYVAIPAYLSGLSIFIFGLSEWSARLPAGIFGILEILLVYLIAKKLFKSERVALSSAFVLALSTWGLKISRIMLDSSTALFFYLLGIYLFISARNVRKSILAIVSLSIGTLSYYGSLFVFPFAVIALFFYRLDFIRKKKSQFILGASLVFSVFFIVLGLMLFTSGQSSRSSGRSGELIFFQKKNIIDSVIYQRSNASAPTILSEIFINKATFLWRTFFFNYLEAFSPRMIFVEGDPNANYGLWGRGELSILDFPLLLLGLFYLYKKNKKAFFLAGSMVLISPITSGLTGTVYASRAFLMWPFLIIICGGGLAFIYERLGALKEINWKTCIFLGFLGIYIFFFFSRIHQYFYRYPNYAKEAWFHSEKQLAEYLINHPDKKIDIYSLEGRQVFMEYLFFSRLDPSIAQSALDKNNIKAPIQIGNFKFINGCFDWEKYRPENKVIVNTHCVPLDLSTATEIIKSLDGSDEVKWAIFNL